jgi:Cd2+/Zn2+-exporting ATPase
LPEQRRELYVLLGSGLVFAAALWAEQAGIVRGRGLLYAIYAAPYLLCGLPVLAQAGRRLACGDLFNEFSLMSGATIAAVCLGHMGEAVGVMLFYRVGEFAQELALNGSRKSIRALLAARPVSALVLDESGAARARPVEEAHVGDLILVRAGDKIPLDGVVVSGSSQIDSSPLTGESLPLTAEPGSEVMAGCINGAGSLHVRVSSLFADSHMARILDMVENAAERKSPTERFISRFARWYTPAVTGAAVLTALLPPLLAGADWQTWIYRALVLLVISCPCALLISVPLGYFGGIGAASRRGILVKGGGVLDGMLRVRAVLFDKTGTLSQGRFSIARLCPAPGVDEETLLAAAALAESRSSHPLAEAVLRRYRSGGGTPPPVDLTREIAGQGMEAEYAGRLYLAGTAALLRRHGISCPEEEARESGSLILVAVDGRYLGSLTAEDTLKPDAAATVAALKKRGLKTILLSGDRPEIVRLAAKSLGLDEFRAGLLPDEKVRAMEEMSSPEEAVFVGDGINDVPALALARVGIAMGGLGSETAVEAADAVILNDSPLKVDELYGIACRVRQVVWQNIILALGIKMLVMGLGISGLSGLWEAVFADVGVALLAVLNALRVMRNPPEQEAAV